jgi:hypothetical protein
MSPDNVTGASNYYLLVHSAFGESQVPLILWFFDTHSYGCMNDSNSDGCIEPS